MKSMTGYGDATRQIKSGSIRIEVRTLNNRYTDLNIKINKDFLWLETDIQKKLKQVFTRGKIDAFVSIETSAETANLPKWNQKALAHFLKLSHEAKEIASSIEPTLVEQAPIDIIALFKIPELLRVENSEIAANDENLKAEVLQTLSQACEKAQESRSKEGASLQTIMEGFAQSLKVHVAYFKSKTDDLRADLHTRLSERLEAVLSKLKEQKPEASLPSNDRLAQEVIVLVEKADIQEEIARLEAHCEQFYAFISSQGPIGRKLDFLCQELGREANTILSKSYRPDIKEVGVELKHCIEQIRQQVQNIE